MTSNCLALKQDNLPVADKQKIVLMQAEACLALQEPQQAMALYQQALALGADRAIVVPKLFNIYQSRQMHKEIIQLSGAAVPGVSAEALSTVRTEALLALGCPAEAEVEARKVQAGSPFFARVSFSLAQALIRAVAEARAFLPKDKLAEVLYTRLFALHQEKDFDGILQKRKFDEGCALLDAFIQPSVLTLTQVLRNLRTTQPNSENPVKGATPISGR